MSEKKFQTGEAIRFGWETTKENIAFLAALLIIAFLIKSIPEAIAQYAGAEFPVIYYTLLITGWLLGFVVDMGLIKVSLQFCDQIKGKLDDLLSSFDLLLPYIVASIIYSLILIVGLLLFIVPGVIWGIKFSLYPYYIIEKGLGPIEALKASSRTTMGSKWDLLVLWLLLLLLNIGGALVFLVGLFATIPTSMVAYAYVYRKLSGEPEQHALMYEL